MLTTLTTITTLACLGLAQLPTTVELPAALEGARIEVTLQTTADHFAADNASDVVQVLLFGAAGLTPQAVRLEPGARVLYPFPRGVVEKVTVEVVALDESGWRNTGAVALSRVRTSNQGAAWVQAGPDSSVVWTLDADEGLAHMTPTDQLVPEAWRAAHPELNDLRTSVHVPVPLPTGGKKTSKPPVIEKRKLPPV
jgi:hypothetical protein